MKQLFTLLLLISVKFASPQDKIHWGSTGDPLHGLTITWHSETIGDKIRWGYTTSYENGEFDGIRRDDYAGNLYDYNFPTVNVKDTIHYSIYTDSWSVDNIFVTASNANKFTFMSGGDSQNDNVIPWRTASAKVATEDFDFFLFTGDNVKYDDNIKDWNNWWDNGVDLLQNNLIYYTGGNHEYGSFYLNQFVLPGNEKWYTFKYGDVLFISMLTEAYQDSQYVWLKNVLDTTKIKWKVLFFHKPFFSSGIHGGDMAKYKDTWWKALDDYGVDIVLNGHDHFYLRTMPINCNVNNIEAVSEYGSNPGQGRLEIVTGSMGADLYYTRDKWFVGVNKKTMNYVRFDVDGDTIQMRAYNISGNVIDSVTLSKNNVKFSADFISSIEECNLTVDFISKYSNDTVSYLWDFGDDSISTDRNPTHTYLNSGKYNVKLTVNNGISDSTVEKIIILNYSDTPKNLSAIKNTDGTINLSAEASGVVNWYDSPKYGKLLGTGNDITIPQTTKTTFYAENVTGNAVIYKGAKTEKEDGKYYTKDSVCGLEFSTKEDIKLKTIKIYNNISSSGKYLCSKSFLVKNNLGDIVAKKDVYIKEGEQRIALDMLIPAGDNYRLLINNSSELWIDTNNINYPYNIDNIVTIVSGIKSDSVPVLSKYYFFYDWEIETGTPICLSDIESVSIETAVKDDVNTNIYIYPNPVKNDLNINNLPVNNCSIVIYNNNLQQVKAVNSNGLSNIKINFNELSSGVYFCKIMLDREVLLINKIVIIK